MSAGLVAIVDPRRPVDAPVAAMLARMRHRGPLTATEAVDGAALGWIGRGDPGLCVHGDVAVAFAGRLDARDGPGPDAAFVARGYARHGEAWLGDLVGEFALVVWDRARRVAIAARDPLGIRPLYAHRAGSAVAFASEVDALLALPGVSRDVDPDAVLDYLLVRSRRPRSTFFRDVARTPAGHLVRVDGDGISERRAFWPPAEIRATPEEAAHGFRAVFERAVADRVDAGGPIVVELSGGLDSSSIAGVVGRLTRSTPATLVSAVYPEVDHDESALQAAVAARAGLPWVAWRAFEEGGDRAWPAPPAHPFQEVGSGVLAGVDAVARRTGAVAVLTGIGGDELVFERGVFEDLAARGHLRTLVRETAGRRPTYSTRTWRHWLEHALRAQVPEVARASTRRWRHGPPPRPDWLGPALVDRFDAVVDEEAAPELASATAQRTWEWVTGPAMVQALDWLDLEYARRGLEARVPFLDARVVRYVLSLPTMARLPRGRMKRLLRDAMADVLPPEVALRGECTTFGGVIRRQVAARRGELEALLADGRWASADYVDRRAVAATLARVGPSPDDGTLEDWRWLRAVVGLEGWLRAATQGTVEVRRSTMQNPKADAGVAPEAKNPSPAYEAPVLVQVGSLDDLLGKTGSASDSSHANPHRP